MNNCPKCGEPLINVQANFHASTRNENGRARPGIFGRTAYCKKCNLPYSRITQGINNNSGWNSTEIISEYLVRRITKDELDYFNKIVKEFKSASKDWADFRKYELESDEFFLYENPKNSSKGIAMVRNGEPILSYYMHNFLYNRITIK